MGYVLVLLGASMAVGSPPAKPAQTMHPAAIRTAVSVRRRPLWKRIAGAEPALALKLSSWGIGRGQSVP